MGQVILPNCQNFSDLIASKFTDVRAVHLNENTLVSEESGPYDADTDEIGSDISSEKCVNAVNVKQHKNHNLAQDWFLTAIKNT